MPQRRGPFWRYLSRAHGETRMGGARTRCGQLLRHSAGCWTFLAMVLERRLAVRQNNLLHGRPTCESLRGPDPIERWDGSRLTHR